MKQEREKERTVEDPPESSTVKFIPNCRSKYLRSTHNVCHYDRLHDKH